jgi:DNA topoisomerase I
LRRRRSGKKGFRYLNHDGSAVTEPGTIERITALVIPPAWREVRICPSASGKIQALGIDAKGRIQYLYHPKFAAAQKRKKFAKIERFGEFLPQLRRSTNEHIGLNGFPLEKVCAIMTRLIDRLYIRMGSEKSEKEFRTYGITTLRRKHISFDSRSQVTFQFVGKSYIKHRRVLVDKELAALLRELSSLGRGGKLFKYFDAESKLRPVKPSHLNQYIKSLTSPDYSAKDFRTWGATVNALAELSSLGPPEDEKSAAANIRRTIKHVAEILGNTVSVCRESYIHPVVLERYACGKNVECFIARINTRRKTKFAPELEEPEVALCELFRMLNGN